MPVGVAGRIIQAMGTTAKSSAKRSDLWIIPVCVVPGLVAPMLRVAVWYYHLGALQLALVTGVASVAGFAAVAAWAALRGQPYWALVWVCAVSAVLLTLKLAPFAFRALAA